MSDLLEELFVYMLQMRYGETDRKAAETMARFARMTVKEQPTPRRRKSVPTPAVPACEPAPGVSPIPQVQGRAGDDTPADIPSVSSPAGDMPDIPVAMRRVPRT